MSDLVEILTRHQWEFDNRYYCICQAEIRYNDPESADRMMAEHQADMLRTEPVY